jgi:hypothetical protein
MSNNDFINGLFGGATGVLISHPFDTIKTRIQTNNNLSIKDVIKQGKLYNGIVSPLFGIMLEKSIVFGSFESSKKYINNDFINGLFAGFMSTVIVTPVDKIKIHFQNKNSIKLQSGDLYILSPKKLYK